MQGRLRAVAGIALTLALHDLEGYIVAVARSAAASVVPRALDRFASPRSSHGLLSPVIQPPRPNRACCRTTAATGSLGPDVRRPHPAAKGHRPGESVVGPASSSIRVAAALLLSVTAAVPGASFFMLSAEEHLLAYSKKQHIELSHDVDVVKGCPRTGRLESSRARLPAIRRRLLRERRDVSGSTG